MVQLPEFVDEGDVARLFPVVADTSKEQRAASIFLSVMSAIPAFANALLSQIGQRVGARSSVNTFTEVVLRNLGQTANKDRPDGLIEISLGKRKWTALFEAKIGNNSLVKEQVERYLRLARDNSIDALITVSNEFSAHPTHHPVQISKTLTRRVSLYHFSWTSILTEAVLMHEQHALPDIEQAFLLREFVRYFSHDSVGVNGFTSMPKEWSDAIERIQAGGKIRKGEIGEEIIWGWHQELRELTLRMSKTIGCNVHTKLSRSQITNPEARIGHDIDQLCIAGVLNAALEIPNAASVLNIVADLRSRILRISMTLDAPKDKKTAKARLNWLLRQLKIVEPTGVNVGIIWASRAPTWVISLAEIREYPERLEGEAKSANIRAFEVTITSNNVRRFSGRRTFIEELEHLVPDYYERIGQHLQAWTPSPPKPVHSVEKQESGPARKIKPKIMAQPGNAHGELLDIPVFLQRNVS